MIFFLLLAVSVTADLQCYVCTDCEFNYEGTAKTCEDIQVTTIQPVISTTNIEETSTTDDDYITTDETTQPTETTDPSTTEETASTEPSDTTTHLTELPTDGSTNVEPRTTDSPIKITTHPKVTDITSTEGTTTEYITEITTDVSTMKASPTIMIPPSTSGISATTTPDSITKTTLQTEAQESTVLPVITSTHSETESFISTTEAATTPDSKTEATSQAHVQASTNVPVTTSTLSESVVSTTQSVTTSQYPTSTDTSTNIVSTLRSTTDSSVTSSETLPTSIDALSTTTTYTTEAYLETFTTDSSMQTGSTLSSSEVSSTDESTTEYTDSTTDSDVASTIVDNLLDNEPNVMIVGDSKKYASRYRFIRAAQTKQNAGSKPRCIVSAYKENNRTIVVRGCSFGDEEQDCNSVLDGKVHINNSKCFVCNTDLCNSAPPLSMSVFILLATPLISTFAVRYL